MAEVVAEGVHNKQYGLRLGQGTFLRPLGKYLDCRNGIVEVDWPGIWTISNVGLKAFQHTKRFGSSRGSKTTCFSVSLRRETPIVVLTSCCLLTAVTHTPENLSPVWQVRATDSTYCLPLVAVCGSHSKSLLRGLCYFDGMVHRPGNPR